MAIKKDAKITLYISEQQQRELYGIGIVLDIVRQHPDFRGSVANGKIEAANELLQAALAQIEREAVKHNWVDPKVDEEGLAEAKAEAEARIKAVVATGDVTATSSIVLHGQKQST